MPTAEQKRAKRKKAKASNRPRTRAHLLVGWYVREGKLIRQPCEVCGESKVEGHHDDYSKPLEVRWLCKRHHLEVHRAMRSETK